MKNTIKIILFLLPFILISCSITRTEKNIINSFVNETFKEKKYENYEQKKNILIKDAGDGKSGLILYEKIYNDTSQINYKYQYWFLNRDQINEAKKRRFKKHFWTNSDIYNYKFEIIDSKKNSENYKNQFYLNLADNFLIFSFSKPLIINKNEALIWFLCTSKYGNSFERCVVLLKKDENNYWKIILKYYDPNSSW